MCLFPETRQRYSVTQFSGGFHYASLAGHFQVDAAPLRCSYQAFTGIVWIVGEGGKSKSKLSGKYRLLRVTNGLVKKVD